MTSQPQAPKERLWTSANIVTLLRICGVPLFVVAMLSPWPTWLSDWPAAESWKEWIAAGIFILLAATDALDGYLARSRGEITNFGKFMDPLADKILVAAALLALVELRVLPSWVALVILCREFIVSGLRMVAANQGVVIQASWYGKAKTVAQIIAIVLFIIKDNHMVSDFSQVLSDKLYLISWAVMIVALILTIISMLDYFVKAKDVLGFNRSLSQSNKTPETKGGFGDSIELSSEAQENPTDSLDDLKIMIPELSRDVLARASKQKLRIGTAESCTGGLVASALTAIPGSSEVVWGGIVSYSNDVKRSSLGVSEETLERNGAVSKQTAEEMAEGARRTLGVDIAVSITGIAGPGGDGEGKPVGLVWFGLATDDEIMSAQRQFKGNRTEIRFQSTYEALRMIRDMLKTQESTSSK